MVVVIEKIKRTIKLKLYDRAKGNVTEKNN